MAVNQHTLRSGLFITGTDTDVGKTWVGAQLVRLLYQGNVPVRVRKPVESGCALVNGELIPNDASAYFNAIEQSEALPSICPHRFEAAISPHQAAQQAGQSLTLHDLIHACDAPKSDFLLVEGAGGICSPIANDGLNIDLAHALKLPMLLVVNAKLGCINHALLSIRAIEQAGLSIHAVFINAQNPCDQAFAQGIEQYTDAPIINGLTDLVNMVI